MLPKQAWAPIPDGRKTLVCRWLCSICALFYHLFALHVVWFGGASFLLVLRRYDSLISKDAYGSTRSRRSLLCSVAILTMFIRLYFSPKGVSKSGYFEVHGKYLYV